MSKEFVRIGLSEPHVAVLALNRPPVNALGSELREQFVAAMDNLAGREDVRAIVLTSDCKVFSAGADIKEKRDLAASFDGYSRANRLTRDSFLAIRECPKPVIAAVNGPALGAGFIMAACCDLIVASQDAWFQLPEIDVGQGGGAAFLQELLPRGKMRRMMLTGDRVPAAEFHRIGAVEECVPLESTLPVAISIAATIAAKSPRAVHAIRSHFETVSQLGLYEGFLAEQRYVSELSRTSDAEEARQAFFEKRKPRYD